MLFLVSLLLVALQIGPGQGQQESCFCGQPNLPPTKIVGGNATTPNKFPWHAGIKERGTDKYVCGGSLISEKWVLSAAHCFWDETADLIIGLGDHDQSTTAEVAHLEIDIEKVVKHQNYGNQANFNYDYALVKLKTPVDFEAFPKIRPVCLPTRHAKPNEMVTVIGWGLEDFKDTEQPNVLREVNIPALPIKKCKQSFEAGEITSKMFCAGLDIGGKDSCQFDSGGGVLIWNENRYEIVGIVSWGFKCALPFRPGVYSKVRHRSAKSFIAKKTGVVPMC